MRLAAQATLEQPHKPAPSRRDRLREGFESRQSASVRTSQDRFAEDRFADVAELTVRWPIHSGPDDNIVRQDPVRWETDPDTLRRLYLRFLRVEFRDQSQSVPTSLQRDLLAAVDREMPPSKTSIRRHERFRSHGTSGQRDRVCERSLSGQIPRSQALN